jgi:hypothetical protein
VKRAWLKRDEELGTMGSSTGGTQCDDFGVWSAGWLCSASADDDAIAHDDSADWWIGAGAPGNLAGCRDRVAQRGDATADGGTGLH